MSDANEATIWLDSYDEVRDAFSHRALHQASYDTAKQSVFADVLVTLDGPEHLRRRQAETALVRPGMVALVERQILPEAARGILATYAGSGEADLVEVLRIVTTALAADLVGLDECRSIERLDALDRVTRRLFAAATIDWSLRDPAAIVADAEQAAAEYRTAFLRPALERRRAALNGVPDEPGARTDLLSILLRHREVLGMDDGRILRESIHFLLATAHTTSNSVVHAFDDYWRWLADHPEDRPRMRERGFVQRCIHETLRLRPPTGFQMRVASDTCTLKSGRTFTRGDRIGLNLVAASHDPAAYGPDAAEFRPHRETSALYPSYGFAFGLGTHACLGKRLSTGGSDPVAEAGTLLVLMEALLDVNCRPHPTRAPEVQAGTQRHQFRTYDVTFEPAGAPVRAPLAHVPAAPA